MRLYKKYIAALLAGTLIVGSIGVLSVAAEDIAYEIS